MNLEIEATFLEINKTLFREQLTALGAKLIHPEILMRRTVFYTGKHSFTRVRDEGNKIILTYKIHHDDTLTGTEEYNVEVSDYNDTITILKHSGLRPKSEQESLREEWELDGVKIDIDTWPWLPTFVEIEGETPEAVRSVAKKLGFDFNSAIFNSVDEVYHLYYNVTCDDINNHFPIIKFTSAAPALLFDHVRKTPLAPATLRPEKSCGAIIIHNGKTLLVHQTNNFWSFPKGHIESGETEAEAAIREVKEETNLDIDIDESTRQTLHYVIEDSQIDKEVVLFTAKLKDSAKSLAKQDSEIAEARWVPLAEVESLLDRAAWKSAWQEIYPKLPK